jgi:hypothetical protein
VDEHRISPAGDPFTAKAEGRVFRPRSLEDVYHPHCCINGWVYLAYTAHDEELGVEVEKIEMVPCRRCAIEAEEVGGGR